jgi:hypothetical protein
MENELVHFRVLGMNWGVRKDRSSGGTPKSTVRLANKDARRHADAKMFYGEGAGTKRKLLKAEIDRKKKTIDGYEDAFNEALANADYSKSAKKAVAKRKTADAVYTARVSIKRLLGVTGSLTIAAAGALYVAHKPRIDAFIVRQMNKAA